MPEGPEIRRAADRVADAIGGARALEVRFGLDRLRHHEVELCNHLVERVRTHGKAMLIDFDCGRTIFSHNQLYGRWYTGTPDETPTTHRSLRLAIRTGRGAALLYSASTIEVLATAEAAQHPFLGRLGPDVLHATTSVDQIRQRLTAGAFVNRSLGLLLTDQAFVAGLGNYLRCELLFLAGLAPSIKVRDCRPAELDRLATLILELPRQSYSTGGITNAPERAERLMAAGVSFEQARFHLFRRAGLPCYRCGNTIEKRRSGGQSCYLCPHCQRPG
jgi:endonuclease-8